MSVLRDIIKNITPLEIKGSCSVEITSLGLDSREAVPGQLFFAVRGTDADGHDYVPQAVAKGVSCVVCEVLPDDIPEGVTFVKVADSNEAIGHIASSFYGNPSGKLKLVGITGTNGKTTTATLLYDLFSRMGYPSGLISTVVYRIGSLEKPSTHTTPDAIRLNAMLAEMAETGCEYCFMEVSSHSIVQKRIAGLEFTGGVFTNITHDHLDYHGTFAEYIKAKKQFFDGLPKGSFALVNIDDRNGSVMAQNTKAKVSTLSLRSPADFKCRIIETHFDGMLLNIDGSEVWVKLLGKFNAYNILSVYAAAYLLGADKNEILTGLSALTAVNGRFEYIRSPKGITAIVDYAHTPDALQNVIDTINEIRSPGHRLITVVGCGGNRDAAKRPVMARIAGLGSDLTILTSDNPRNERPEDIISEMKTGIEPGTKYLAVTDRREAIRTASMMAEGKDIILIAGKGHENYQEIKGVRSHFDDKEEIAKAFAEP